MPLCIGHRSRPSKYFIYFKAFILLEINALTTIAKVNRL